MSDLPHVCDLFRRLGPGLVLYARTRTGRHDAEDVVQEAFVKFAEAIAKGQKIASPAAWLATVVRNAMATRGRAAQVRGAAGVESPRLFARPAGNEPAVGGRAVTEALWKLPDALRETLVLRLWGNLTLDEVAVVTGCSTATAFRNHQRALEAMKRELCEDAAVRPIMKEERR